MMSAKKMMPPPEKKVKELSASERVGNELSKVKNELGMFKPKARIHAAGQLSEIDYGKDIDAKKEAVDGLTGVLGDMSKKPELKLPDAGFMNAICRSLHDIYRKGPEGIEGRKDLIVANMIKAAASIRDKYLGKESERIAEAIDAWVSDITRKTPLPEGHETAEGELTMERPRIHGGLAIEGPGWLTVWSPDIGTDFLEVLKLPYTELVNGHPVAFERVLDGIYSAIEMDKKGMKGAGELYKEGVGELIEKIIAWDMVGGLLKEGYTADMVKSKLREGPGSWNEAIRMFKETSVFYTDLLRFESGMEEIRIKEITNRKGVTLRFYNPESVKKLEKLRGGTPVEAGWSLHAASVYVHEKLTKTYITDPEGVERLVAEHKEPGFRVETQVLSPDAFWTMWADPNFRKDAESKLGFRVDLHDIAIRAERHKLVWPFTYIPAKYMPVRPLVAEVGAKEVRFKKGEKVFENPYVEFTTNFKYPLAFLTYALRLQKDASPTHIVDISADVGTMLRWIPGPTRAIGDSIKAYLLCNIRMDREEDWKDLRKGNVYGILKRKGYIGLSLNVEKDLPWLTLNRINFMGSFPSSAFTEGGYLNVELDMVPRKTRREPGKNYVMRATEHHIKTNVREDKQGGVISSLRIATEKGEKVTVTLPDGKKEERELADILAQSTYVDNLLEKNRELIKKRVFDETWEYAKEKGVIEPKGYTLIKDEILKAWDDEKLYLEDNQKKFVDSIIEAHPEVLEEK